MKNTIKQKELSIIVPAYQEGERIKKTIKSLIDYFPQAEIIIVNDGSIDSTYRIKDIFQDKIIYLENKLNQGKGYSLRKGFAKAQGKYIIFTDADLPFETQGIENILQNLKQGSQIVIGCRQEFYNDKPYKKLLRPFLYLILLIFFGFKYQDTQCGLKGFSQEVGKKILAATIINGFAIDIEILYLAKKLKYLVLEIAVKQKSFFASTFRLVHMVRMILDIFVIKFHQYKL